MRLGYVEVLRVCTPLFLYAVPASIHNIFGVDLTGGWMGDRDPVGAGYGVLVGLPIYLFGFFAGLEYYFFRPHAALAVTDEYIEKSFKWMFPKRKIRWGDIESVHRLSHDIGDEELIIIASGNEFRITSSSLRAGFADFIDEVEARGFSISKEVIR